MHGSQAEVPREPVLLEVLKTVPEKGSRTGGKRPNEGRQDVRHRQDVKASPVSFLKAHVTVEAMTLVLVC